MARKTSNKISIETAVVPETTKIHLLDAATKIFGKHGYDGATVKDISELAGVNVSLVSYHFGGKEGLYKACIQEFGTYRLQTTQRILTQPQNVEEFKIRFEMFLAEMLECFVQQPEVSRMIQRECEMNLPIAEDVFNKTFLKVFETVVSFIKAGIENGILKKEVDPVMAAGFIMSAVLNVNRNNEIAEKVFKKTLQDPKHRAKVVQQLLILFSEGLLEKQKIGKP